MSCQLQYLGTVVGIIIEGAESSSDFFLYVKISRLVRQDAWVDSTTEFDGEVFFDRVYRVCHGRFGVEGILKNDNMRDGIFENS